VSTPPPGFEQLSKEEQIRYVQELWDLITTVPDEIPIPQWHLDLIRNRMVSHNPQQISSWSEVKQQMFSKYRG
jgi:hypothetical protein